MRLAAIGRIGNPDIAAGNRLDAGFFGRRVELDQGKQVDLISQCHGWHAGLRARSHEAIDADRRIDQRKLAVDVQMNEIRRHGGNKREELTG